MVTNTISKDFFLKRDFGFDLFFRTNIVLEWKKYIIKLIE